MPTAAQSEMGTIVVTPTVTKTAKMIAIAIVVIVIVIVMTMNVIKKTIVAMTIAVVGDVEPVAADEVMKKRRIDKKQAKRIDPCTLTSDVITNLHSIFRG